jgi:hypothetical protein
LGFLRLCGGQCVGADDGGTEQRKSIAQDISRYVVNKVVHHDQTPIEHLIYNFPVLISSTLFRNGVQFSD